MEAVGLASGALALTTFAIQSSKALYDTIESFRSQGRTIRELKQEVEALGGVLQSLRDTLDDPQIDLSALQIPLLRCGQACQEFATIIGKCSTRCTESKPSVRDWLMLTYHGRNVSGFRNLLAAYKSTITIALAGTNM